MLGFRLPFARRKGYGMGAAGGGNEGAAGDPTLVFDQFTDANFTNLTAHAIAPTNTISATWTTLLGVILIQSNTAGRWGGAHPDACVYESSRSDVTITQTHRHGANYTHNHAILRCTDANNFWHVMTQSGDNYWRIVERNANVDTTRASAAKTISTLTNYAISVTASGTTISATIDGGTSISYALATFNQTATKHGVGTNDNSAGYGVDDHNLSA